MLIGTLMHPILILLIAMAAVFLLIIRWKVNAFAALILSAILIGLLSPHVAVQDIMGAVTEAFGGLVGRIGIAIAMAAVIGQCLMESGGAEKITRRFVDWLGEKYSSFSMVISGYILSIPVFHDTVFYLLVPLARSMSMRTGGRNYLLFTLAIGAGGVTTHIFVPPTPGPLAMAETLSIDVGLVILVGLMVAIPSAFACWAYAWWIDRKLDIPIREAPGLTLDELREVSNRPESELPGFFVSLLPIAIPVILITANTVTNTFFAGSGLAGVTAFLGNPNLALVIAAAAGLWLLASHKGMTLRELAKPTEEAIKSAGLIILITAGGGAFGRMLVKAEVGTVLGNYAQEFGLSLMLLGFGIAMLFRIAQGSATTAMITTSEILAPLIIANPPGHHSVYILTAIGAGSIVGGWMNDSGFWVFKTMTGLTEVEALKTKTVSLFALGGAGLLASYLGAWLFPLQ